MTRILSAAVLAAVVLIVLIWLPAWVTVGVAAVVAALGAVELAGFAARASATVPAWFVAAAAAVVTMAFVQQEVRGAAETGLLASALIAIVLLSGVVALVIGPPGPATLTRVTTMVMAPVYLGVPLGVIAWVQWTLGAAATLWLVGTIVVSDSAQYYTGRSLGRRKLAPAISPAKTVEGALGGLMAAAVAGALVGPRVVTGLSPAAGALTGLALGVAGIAGDLFESLLKRGVGVKDSSALIPGHGGVLDRIDAQLFAAPVFYLLLRWLR